MKRIKQGLMFLFFCAIPRSVTFGCNTVVPKLFNWLAIAMFSPSSSLGSVNRRTRHVLVVFKTLQRLHHATPFRPCMGTSFLSSANVGRITLVATISISAQNPVRLSVRDPVHNAHHSLAQRTHYRLSVSYFNRGVESHHGSL
jgi:hypothetical protein